MMTDAARRGFHGWLAKSLNLRKQRTRRLLVLSLLVSYLPWFIVPVLSYTHARGLKEVNGWLIAVFVIIVIVVPSGGIWLIDRFMKKERMTGPYADERQIELYHRAVVTGYRLLTTAITVVLAACGFYLFVNLTNETPPTISLGISGFLFISIFVPELIRNLPKALVLWWEGDLDEPDDPSLSVS
jgi:MFS family permease